ncbi:uncharacterized protein LOC142976049 [Anticarsia gemmatalis]|uniref:uncharacterized protein LOC142976049 n=1 Tax=Anticarsia gemmatalis TaxID=129554 RepID=UPI003F75A361
MSDSDTNTSTPVINFSKKMIPTRDLIEMVRVRRCLWDRMYPGYRDKLEKDKAWYQIYKEFEPNFDTLNQARKNFIGSTITRKWHNARDSYVKSRKGGMRNKPYVYSEELRFLDETLTFRKSRKGGSFVEERVSNDEEQEGSQNWMSEVFVDIDESINNGPTAKRSKQEYDVTFEESPKETPKEDSEENIVSVLVNLIQKEEDEDRAFFKSITPAVKTLSESSKFEFRIQVMKLINSLKMVDRKVAKLKRERTSNGESDSE